MSEPEFLEQFLKSGNRFSDKNCGKTQELEQSVEASSEIKAALTPPGAPLLMRELAICNKRGLHARASAKFVKLAQSFQAVIEVEKDGLKVGGTSIMGLMLLAASPGCAIRVYASGEEAAEALAALEALVNDRFGEDC